MDRRIRVCFLLCFLCLLVSCSTGDTTRNETDAAAKEVDKELKDPPVKKTEITLSAVGDILIHDRVYKDAQTADGYDFSPMLTKVKPYLEQATITIANQETMIGGEEIGLSGYPSFNSPYEVGDALQEAGVDVVSLANNHTLDRGEKAIQNALAYWDSIGMIYTGSYKSDEDRKNIRIYETEENISIAFLAYTYGTNGIPVPDGKDYLVNFIDRDKMKQDIAIAKEEADVVVLNLHFGNEYERFPSEEQEELVQLAADEGVHIVLGHHSHVLQPVEWVEGEDGNRTLAAYSLGNFLSGQDELYRQIGGILTVEITKTTKGDQEEITIRNPAFLPTYVHFDRKTNTGYKVLPMAEVTDSQLGGAKEHYEEIKTHMQQWMPDLEIIEVEG